MKLWHDICDIVTTPTFSSVTSSPHLHCYQRLHHHACIVISDFLTTPTLLSLTSSLRLHCYQWYHHLIVISDIMPPLLSVTASPRLHCYQWSHHHAYTVISDIIATPTLFEYSSWRRETRRAFPQVPARPFPGTNLRVLRWGKAVRRRGVRDGWVAVRSSSLYPFIFFDHFKRLIFARLEHPINTLIL